MSRHNRCTVCVVYFEDALRIIFLWYLTQCKHTPGDRWTTWFWHVCTSFFYPPSTSYTTIMNFHFTTNAHINRLILWLVSWHLITLWNSTIWDIKVRSKMKMVLKGLDTLITMNILCYDMSFIHFECHYAY